MMGNADPRRWESPVLGLDWILRLLWQAWLNIAYLGDAGLLEVVYHYREYVRAINRLSN